MKNTFKLLAIAILLCGLALPTIAQVTLNSSATAVIVQTMTLAKNQDLHFGNLAVTTVGGTCVLDPEAGVPTRTPSGGVTLPAFIGTPLAAEFLVTGVSSMYYTISIPQNVLTITRITGTETMTVDTYTTDQTVVTASTWFGQLDALNGESTFYVGGTVHVAANQVAGTYTNAGGFPVTVNYQ
jgi:hypothetical protein